MAFGAAEWFTRLLERANSLPEMKDFPKGNPDVQQADAGDRAAHPPGSNHGLYDLQAGLSRRIHKKIIIPPVAQAQRALRNPRQQRKHNANFKAKDDVKDDA
jgi:hypothetical protein